MYCLKILKELTYYALSSLISQYFQLAPQFINEELTI